MQLHLVARAHQVVRDEQPDVARSCDRDPHQARLPHSMCACSSSVAAIVGDEHEHVALLADHVGGHDLRLAEARDRA